MPLQSTAPSAERHAPPLAPPAGGQRERLVSALIDAVAEQGYEATTVFEIVGRAGVAKSTFYQHFANKEELFVTAFDQIASELTTVMDSAVERADSWPAAVESGVGAILGFFAARPSHAPLFLVESLSVGGGVRRYEELITDLFPFLDPDRVKDPPDALRSTLKHLKETVAGGILWILFQQVRRGEAKKMEELCPELVEFVLAPYLSAGKAGGVERGSRGSSVPLSTLIRNADRIRARSQPAVDSLSAAELIREDRER